MKKLFAFALVAVLAAGVLTACRAPADDSSSTSTTATTATTATTTMPTTAPTTAATTIMPTLPGDTLDSTGSTVATGKMPRMR